MKFEERETQENIQVLNQLKTSFRFCLFLYYQVGQEATTFLCVCVCVCANEKWIFYEKQKLNIKFLFLKIRLFLLFLTRIEQNR